MSRKWLVQRVKCQAILIGLTPFANRKQNSWWIKDAKAGDPGPARPELYGFGHAPALPTPRAASGQRPLKFESPDVSQQIWQTHGSRPMAALEVYTPPLGSE